MFDVEEHYFHPNTEYRKRRDTLVEGLNKIEGVNAIRPAGIWQSMQLPVKDTDAFCQWMLSDFNHEGETVMMAPGGFYATEGKGKTKCIAYVLNSIDLNKAINCLEEGLKAYKEIAECWILSTWLSNLPQHLLNLLSLRNFTSLLKL